MIRGAGRLTKRMDERANDPTPHPFMGRAEQPACCARREGLVCTLLPHHPGYHEAHNGSGVPVLVWWERNCGDLGPTGLNVCTLPRDHEGRHESVNLFREAGSTLLEAWPQLPSTVADGRHLFPQEAAC